MITEIRNATIVTVDADDRVIDRGTIVIDDDRIIAVRDSDRPSEVEPDAIVEARGAIVMPGLINAHAHLAMTMFRGFADDRDLQAFLDRLFPVEERVLTSESIRIGARLAFAESFLAGCTSALDMFWWPEATHDEAMAAGFRLANGPLFFGFDGPDRIAFDERIERASHSGPHEWLLAHGTYTMSTEQLERVARLVHATGARFHIHASENRSEIDDVRARFGASPIELLDRFDLLGPTTVLAHAVVLDDAEVERLGETHTAIAHCPLSNLKLASGVCRVPELIEAGATVALGTDGSASSNDLDMFMAMRMAALLHKGVNLDATILPAATVLRMATIEGARALGIDESVGSIEVGKCADLVLLDPDSPALTPTYDPISTIVYAASRADVTDVWANGTHVVADRRCTTIDLPATIGEMRQVQEAISAHT